MTFKFTSGPAYVLFVALVTAFAFIKGTTFDAYATAMFGALVWYTGRRAYKEVKLANIEMKGGECADAPAEEGAK